MRSKIPFAGLVLCLTVFASVFQASDQGSSTKKLEGVINDFSPRSTNPTGPYLVNGTGSLQLHANGKSDFTASRASDASRTGRRCHATSATFSSVRSLPLR